MKHNIITSLAITAALGVATQASGQQATLVIEAYNADGRGATLQNFLDFTHYIASSTWEGTDNYGVFLLGAPPATPSLAGPLVVEPQGGLEYLSFNVPCNQPIYFTALWKAQGIGTVYMRADNAEQGYLLPCDQRLVLQLPYEFARSEYALAD